MNTPVERDVPRDGDVKLNELEAPQCARALAALHLPFVWLDGGAGEHEQSLLFFGELDRIEIDAAERATWDALDAAGQQGFWAGAISYDAAWTMGMMRKASRHDTGGSFPAVSLSHFATLLVFSKEGVRLFGERANLEALYVTLVERREAPPRRNPLSLKELRRPDHARHIEAIRLAKAEIEKGEVYQLNLAHSWTAKADGDLASALETFLAMRSASPVPRGAFVGRNKRALLSVSMETYFEWSPDAQGRGVIRSAPIKGTVARQRSEGSQETEAAALAEEAAALRADPKEHAEHAMIVDLIRNDLGRVAEIGSVRVEHPFSVRPFAKLQHMVSDVVAMTREGSALSDIFEATFPPGSVTGTPKLRAMEIIDRLEARARGAYCGAIGCVVPAEVMRHDALDSKAERLATFSVAIRTAQWLGESLRYDAGGGIVWPSDPEREVAETELKALAFLDAIGSD